MFASLMILGCCVAQNETVMNRKYGQRIKTLIDSLNSIGLHEENDEGANRIIGMLKTDAAAMPQPERSVVYSMLAQIYETYYNQNRWSISGRTNIAAALDDIHTWDARKLTEEAIHNYMLSLQDAKTLQSTPVDAFGEILLQGYNIDYQPSIYDMLANRALAYFSSSFNTNSLPQQTFTVNNPDYFSDVQTFADLKIVTPDTLSADYLSLKIYQELLRFHFANRDVKAMIESDLRRMDFLRSRGRYADNEKLYEEALLKMSRHYKNNAKILLKLADYYCNKGDQWRNGKDTDNKSGYKKALELAERVNNESSDSLFIEAARQMKARVLLKEADVELESVQLPSQPILALLKYRNIDAVYQTVYELSEGEYADFKNVNRYRNKELYEFKDYVKALKAKPTTNKIALPQQSDYQYYTTEIRMDALDGGLYLMIVSDSGIPLQSSVYSAFLIQVSGIAALDRTIDNEMKVEVTDRRTGAPVSGASVTVFGDDRQVGSDVSNNEGFAVINVKQTNSWRRNYTVRSGSDVLFVNDANIKRTYNQRKEDVVSSIILTDRAIYRPGQTVFYKAILYSTKPDDSKKLLKNRTLKVRLRDVNYQTVSEISLVSNDFGSIDGSFTIPQGLLNGNMTLEFEGFGSQNIKVEEYKRPTFEVSFDPVKGNFALNEKVTVTALAKALAGYAIDGAAVQYRVVRSVRYRFYGWWYPSRAGNNREIASGVLKTDNKGAFTVEFDALADDLKDDDRIYTYTVSADVTDINGETRSASVDVQISKKPLLIRTNLTDKILISKLKDFTVATTNLNGDPTKATVKVEITALQSPSKIFRKRLWTEKIDIQTIPENIFRGDFPNDAFGDENNPVNFKALGKVVEYVINTSDSASAAKLNLSALKKSGYYQIKLTADNGKGVVTDDTRYVLLAGDKPEPINSMDEWLTVVKKEGEPMENVEVKVAGGSGVSYVYYELLHKGKIVDSKWVRTGMTPVSLTFPIKEEYRGGFALQLNMVQNSRLYSDFVKFDVPFSNKALNISLSTFRDKLLPGENETWTMRILDKVKAEPEIAEVAATLYDASLDAFVKHQWADMNRVYSVYEPYTTFIYQWHNGTLQILKYPDMKHNDELAVAPSLNAYFTDINWFEGGFRDVLYHGGSRMMLRRAAMPMMAAEESVVVTAYGDGRSVNAAMAKSAAPAEYALAEAASADEDVQSDAENTQKQDLTAVATRTNFNETAFFYPHLVTNEKGELLVQFAIPEALTKWRLFGFAHTKDFKIGAYTNELITQKQVAISANPPRFFRENDEIEFSAKINNLTENDLDGQVLLRLYDAVTQDGLDCFVPRNDGNNKGGNDGGKGSNDKGGMSNDGGKEMGNDGETNFTVQAGGSVSLKWRLKIPEGVQAITYKLTASAGAHSDGEEKTIPVLTNSMLVTETMPFSIRAGKEKSLTFKHLSDNKSQTIRNHSFTLEYTAAPAWYAVQSLPYIMEYPYECAEQTFARYYANSLATSIVNKTPRIKQIFELWKSQDDGKALLSALEKNQELKQVMLEETPWVMSAQSETERKKRLGLLFDLNRMSDELSRAFRKLEKMQNSDGGFPWFESSPSSRYITQHIVAGFGHLKHLSVSSGNEDVIIQKALPYLDDQVWQDYDRLKRSKANINVRQIGAIQLHYLYAASFGKHRPEEARQKEAFEYYLGQTAKYWKEFSTYQKALAALILHRYGQSGKAKEIIGALKERAMQSEELGMYWKDNVAGWFWYQAPIETQALLIEAFNEVAADTQAVEEIKIWLLRNKQTNDWRTTKATSDAVYALLMTGGALLDESKNLEIEIGGKPLNEAAKEEIRPEAGTGYVKTAWHGGDITSQMAHLKVKNPNAKGIAWGGVYWQYFEQLDKITSAVTDLKMNKQLFLRILTPKGEELQPLNENNELKVGDLVRVRMELRADRDYEFVHLKDMRASAFEPVSTTSGYRAQDGLWYYQSIKDASVNFFITYLPKGIYVFEYDLRVQHAGVFSNGITTFQCMYAPEFSSHSEGIKVKIKE
jgi:uncharacterized protein YfaS (alpha-2-macroglobulin family)